MAATLSPFKPPSCSSEYISRAMDGKRLKFSAERRPSRRTPRRTWTSLQSECSTSDLKEVKQIQAPELQVKFGSKNLQFSDVGGKTVAQLKLKSGTSARLLLADARITSFNCLLWHGSLEEFLFTDVLEDSIDSQGEERHGDPSRQLSIIGGMAPSLTHSHDPQVSLFDSNWSIESVKVDPDDHIQMTLLCRNENRGDWHFKLNNVITLTNRGLASALTLTNKDRKPLSFTASVSTHLGIGATEAICCVGVDGCKYFSPSEASLRVSRGNASDSLFQKLKNFVLPFWQENEPAESLKDGMNEMQNHGEGNSTKEELHWFMEKPRQLVSFINGIHKIYLNAPDVIRISDEGLRRSLVFENHGFENLELSSPRKDGDKPFVTVSYSTVLSPITLNKGETWRGAQVLFPDVKDS